MKRSAGVWKRGQVLATGRPVQQSITSEMRRMTRHVRVVEICYFNSSYVNSSINLLCAWFLLLLSAEIGRGKIGLEFLITNFYYRISSNNFWSVWSLCLCRTGGCHRRRWTDQFFLIMELWWVFILMTDGVRLQWISIFCAETSMLISISLLSTVLNKSNTLRFWFQPTLDPQRQPLGATGACFDRWNACHLINSTKHQRKLWLQKEILI